MDKECVLDTVHYVLALFPISWKKKSSLFFHHLFSHIYFEKKVVEKKGKNLLFFPMVINRQCPSLLNWTHWTISTLFFLLYKTHSHHIIFYPLSFLSIYTDGVSLYEPRIEWKIYKPVNENIIIGKKIGSSLDTDHWPLTTDHWTPTTLNRRHG